MTEWVVKKTKTGFVRFKIKEFKTKKEAKKFLQENKGKFSPYTLVIDKK